MSEISAVNPITHLLEEHQAIRTQMADLRRSVADLAARGKAAVPQALPVLRRIGRMMETELALHARKEDEALFPALEALLDADSGPTQVMRQEHRQIHAQGELLRQTLHELNDVEHPQIEAGRERLQQLERSGGDAAALHAAAEEILRLLDMHFEKEEQILFPMAALMLEPAGLEQIDAKMAALRL